MKRRSILVAMMVLLFAMVTVTGVQAAEEKALKVAGIFSVTGKASWLGDPEKKATVTIMDEMNSDGPIKGFPFETLCFKTPRT